MKKLYLVISLSLALLILAVSLSAIDVTVGAGGEQNRKPFDFYYRYSLFETLYYPDELNTAGYIEAITIYNNFISEVNSSGHIQFWLGVTDLPDLSSGWIPSTQLTSVFNRSVVFPAGQNAVRLDLNTPFLYTGGNLVLLARTPGNSGVALRELSFVCQTVGTTRARDYFSNQNNADHSNPPMTTINLTLSGQFPKTTFHFTELPTTTDLAITALSGPTTLTIGQNYTHTVTVSNPGTSAQSAYAVKLYDWNNQELASATGTTLASGANTEIPISWTPDCVEGYSTLYAKVILTGDENLFNNTSQVLYVVFIPDGGVINPQLFGTIKGTVINSQNQPVNGASILINPSNISVITNAAGLYSFAWLLPGNYELTVSAPGYFDQTIALTVAEMQNVICNVRLHSIYDLVITGRVVSGADPGYGIAHATVEIVGAVTTAVSTNSLGYFTIYDVLANETYILRAMHPSYFTYYGSVTMLNANEDVGDLPLLMDTTANVSDVSVLTNNLANCYPNPFRTNTTINYSIKEPTNTSIEIYNTKGQKVRTLVSEFAKSGLHSVVWDGTDYNGNKVSNGIYYFKMKSGYYTSTRKLVLFK